MVTQSFVDFRWTELNSITRPGMGEFDARLTTKRCYSATAACRGAKGSVLHSHSAVVLT